MSPIVHLSDALVCHMRSRVPPPVYVAPTVSNAYSEMKQYSTSKNSECYSVKAASVSSMHTDKQSSEQILAILRLLCKRVNMCNISVLSEMSFHNNEISPVNAKMVKLFCQEEICVKSVIFRKS